MNRQRIRVIALAALVVAAGAYFWTQQSASTVKPAQTSAAKKPGPQGKLPAAKPGAAAPKNTSTAIPSSVPAAARTTPAAKSATPPPATPALPPATKSAAVVPPPAAKSAPVFHSTAAASKSAAVAPATVPAPASAPVFAAVEPGSWQDQLQKGAYLAEKVRPRLPEGTDLLVASGGFRDLQQFVATVNASHNLKLNFEELKRRVVTDRKGLASAIDAMKKVASATIEEQRAEYEARGLIQEAKRQPAPPPPAAKAVPAKAQPQPKKPIRSQSGL